MGIYTDYFKVRNYESGYDGRLSEVSLLKYLGEIATDHSQSIGLGLKELSNRSAAWMIYKWKLDMESYPKIGEKIRIDTWTSRIYKFYANREFNIYDCKDKLLGRASSLWIYVDTNRRMPTRIPADFKDIYKIKGDINFESFIDIGDIEKADESRELKVRKADIDFNQHVNNAVYLGWMLEALPLEFSKYKMIELDIIYKKESKLGDIIKSEYELEEINKDKYKVKHIISTKDGELKTYGETLWLKL